MVTAKKPTETAVVRKLTRPRRAASGDVAPDNSDKSFEDFAVKEGISAAQESKAVAVKDIIAHLSGKYGSVTTIPASHLRWRLT